MDFKMQTPTKLFEDLIRLSADTGGLALSARKELEGLVKMRMSRLLDEMDLITREEYNVLSQRFDGLNQQIAELKQRIEKLEKD